MQPIIPVTTGKSQAQPKISLVVYFIAALALRAFAQTPPQIQVQPEDQSVSIGANVTNRVTAGGTAPLNYQWRFNQTKLVGETGVTLILTNIQLAQAGEYAVVVANDFGSVTSRLARLEVDPAFMKITTGPIVTDGGSSVACAWGDYDGDGWPDLFVSNSQEQRNFLYHNRGDGTFERVLAGPIANDVRNWRGCSWVDYDNDGNLDLVATCVDQASFQVFLYHNNGSGTFTRIPLGGAVFDVYGACEQPAWADYDKDGFVDLFVARYGSDWLFHNNGQGGFTRITNNLAGGEAEHNYVAGWADYNNDGWPDLLVTDNNDPATNRLYLNHGNGTFEQVTSEDIVTGSAHSGVPAWGDYDNDGFPDLFVVNDGDNENNALYHNNGDGTFTKMTADVVGSLVSDGNASTCAWGDYDNDGYLDLYVTDIGPDLGLGRKNFLYHNNGDGSFTRILSGSLANDVADSVGCAWADYDNDGFLDLFVANGGHVNENNCLYRNNGNTNGWLKIKLVGTLSNRSAVGAKIRLKATIHGKTFWQLREIAAGGPCQGPLEAHFGLGDATNIDLVRIQWPSGIWHTLTNVLPKQSLTVTETAPAGVCDTVTFAPTVVSVGYGGPPAIGDFNADGISDIVVGGPSGKIAVLLGKGDGTLQSAVQYSAGIGSAVTVADFNGDGKLDLAGFSFTGGAISVVLGNGDGTFQTPIYSSADSIHYGDYWFNYGVAADLNADGKLDLVEPHNGAGSVAVMMGNGDGTFKSAYSYPAGLAPISVVVGDFNHDGKLDLAVADTDAADNHNQGLLVLLGNGDGTFQTAVPYDLGTNLQPRSLAVGDLNGDGNPDLVVGIGGFGWGNAVGAALIFLGTGDGTFQRPASYNVPGVVPTSLAIGDFNGDGKPDLIAAGSGDESAPGGTSILIGNGDGTFQTAIAHPGPSLTSMAVGDFNGDGKLDFVTLWEDFFRGPMTAVWLNTSCVPSPVLTVGSGSGKTTLSWPATALGYVLESSLTLNPGTWTLVDSQPVNTNGRLGFTMTSTNAQAYFRLRKAATP